VKRSASNLIRLVGSIFLLFLISPAGAQGPAVDPGRYRIVESDVSVHVALARMAKADGVTLLWQAGPSAFRDATVTQPEILNQAAGLDTAVSFKQAFVRLLAVHRNMTAAGDLGGEPLLSGCIFAGVTFVVTDSGDCTERAVGRSP
jgi:hypothetical protein